MWTNGFENYLVINDVVVRSDDKILINCTFTSNTGENVLIKQLLPEGSPDSAFATNSEWIRVNTPVSGNYTYSAMCLLEDESLLCSSSQFDDQNFTVSTMMHKLNPQGEEDLSFQTVLDEGLVPGSSLRLHSFGNVFYILMDNALNATVKELRCYDMSGNLISGFGAGGIALLNENNLPPLGGAEFNVGPDGNIYIAAAEIGGKSNVINLVIANLGGMEYEPIIGVETQSTATWKLFPCPAEQFVILENFDPGASFTIVNESGQVVKTIKRALSATLLVDVSSLAAGKYFVHETTTNTVMSFIVLPH